MIAPSTPSQHPPDKQSRPYRPRGGVLKAWRSGHDECIIVGPAGTGKTRGLLEKGHYCCDKYPGARVLLARKTRHSLSQTAMVTLEQKVIPSGWFENKRVHFDTAEQQYSYQNGSIIAVAGLDKPSKVMSGDFDLILVPEATELFLHDWELLTTRLRNGVMPFQQLLGDCNPGSSKHWLKKRIDSGLSKAFESRHEDNPSVTEAYLKKLRALTGVRRLRLYEGRWAVAEGLVYDTFDTAIHVISRTELLQRGILHEDETINHEVIRRCVAGVDWGLRNAGSLTVYGEDGDGRLYLLREVYMTGKTIEWWIGQAKALKKEFRIERFICDPSEPEHILQFNNAGLRAVKAINDITPGIEAVQERLQLQEDGRPRLFIYEYALLERDPELIESVKPIGILEEIDEYVWDDVTESVLAKEIPMKAHEHSLDGLRYVCMWMKKPRQSGGMVMDTTLSAVTVNTHASTEEEEELTDVDLKYAAFFS